MKKSLENSRQEAQNIIEEGKKEAEKDLKKKAFLEARQEIFNLKT